MSFIPFESILLFVVDRNFYDKLITLGFTCLLCSNVRPSLSGDKNCSLGLRWFNLLVHLLGFGLNE